MIATLTGGNAFGLQQELARTIDGFTQEHGDLALERVDAEEASYERITEALTSLPFLASRKMVVLRAPSTNKKFVEHAEQLLAEVPETTEVVIVEPKLDKRQAYYKYLQKKTDYREFKEPDQQGIASWLAATAKDRGGSLSLADARLLVERTGASQQALGNELEKLLLYNPKISRESIELLVDETPQSTIFQLLEAAFAGNGRRALKLFDEQRALKVESPQIIAMLAWQLHVLALVKTAGDRSADQVASEAKLSPFVVRKSQALARQLSIQDIRRQVASLLSIDRRAKRTNLDLDEALKAYLLKLGN